MSKEETTRVIINDRYSVDIDRAHLNHTLTESYINSKQQPAERVIGYYPNLVQCLRKVEVLQALSGGEISLDDYIKRLEKLSIN